MSNMYNWSHRKLTDQQANEIRRDYSSNPNLSYMILAKKYNVSDACIQRIIKNRAYNYPNPLTKQGEVRQASLRKLENKS